MPLLRPTVRLGAWRRIPKRLVNVETLKVDLMIYNPEMRRQMRYVHGELPDEPGPEEWIKLWREYEDDPAAIYVPRAYVPKLRSKVGVVTPEMAIQFKRVKWPKDKIKLGPHKHKKYDQHPAYEALVAPPEEHFGRLLVLGCGKGKTVIALKAGMQRRVPIFVIVDTNELAEQWEDRIVEYCRIPRSDIGRYQGKRREWDGYPITVLMAQTLMRKEDIEYPEEFRRYPGLVIYDEVHVMGAPVFSRCASIFYGERWALTATPNRMDDLDKVYRYHIAPTPCYEDITQDLVPTITFHKTGVTEPDVFIFGPKTWKKRRWTAQEIRKFSRGQLRAWGKVLKTWSARPEDIIEKLKQRVNIPATLTKLAENEHRNQQILRLVRAKEREGRKVFVLGGRTNQLVWLYNNYSGDAGLVHGKVAAAERKTELRHYNVVFAAQKILVKGFDRDEIDTLVLLALDPQVCTDSNLQQVIGRIQRDDVPGKQEIEVHIFWDEQSEALLPTYGRVLATLRRVLGQDVEIHRIDAPELSRSKKRKKNR